MFVTRLLHVVYCLFVRCCCDTGMDNQIVNVNLDHLEAADPTYQRGIIHTNSTNYSVNKPIANIT